MEPNAKPEREKDPNAVALGHKGGVIGGLARGKCKRRDVDYRELVALRWKKYRERKAEEEAAKAKPTRKSKEKRE